MVRAVLNHVILGLTPPSLWSLRALSVWDCSIPPTVLQSCMQYGCKSGASVSTKGCVSLRGHPLR